MSWKLELLVLFLLSEGDCIEKNIIVLILGLSLFLSSCGVFNKKLKMLQQHWLPRLRLKHLLSAMIYILSIFTVIMVYLIVKYLSNIVTSKDRNILSVVSVHTIRMDPQNVSSVSYLTELELCYCIQCSTDPLL